jgi:predicted negative regulator of RcsB-dependent stress response
VARITRKELKKDAFTQEVTHTVEYLGEHRRQAVRYGAIALAVVLLAGGLHYFSKWRAEARQQALGAAMTIQEAPIGPASPGSAAPNYPTEAARNNAAQKAFGELAAKYAGTDEAVVARYFLGTMAAEEGRLDEAERVLKEVAGSNNTGYASLAKLTLANVYNARDKAADAEKLLRSLIEKPTIFVSKEQATIALAHMLASSKPDEARKLVEPLTLQPPPYGKAAFGILNQLPKKRG